MKRVVNALFVLAGFLFLALGTVGIFFPVLPTTPFYLLTVACFARGSQHFHDWFVGTKLYEKHLSEFVATRSMTLRAKLTICVSVFLIVCIALWMVGNLHVTIAVLALMCIKWWYFAFRIGTTPVNVPTSLVLDDDALAGELA
ncbi:MAG: YbaN family protein [Propionibacteriaceae bacterium]|nr:YbaN family protein [Propionibacteriaceae bacterium]